MIIRGMPDQAFHARRRSGSRDGSIDSKCVDRTVPLTQKEDTK